MTVGRLKNLVAIALLLLGGALTAEVQPVFANQVDSRSLTLSSSRGSEPNVTYTFGFSLNSSYMLGSIVMEICVEDPLPNQPCTSPVGFNGLGATLLNQNGETGFSIHPNSTINRIVLGRVPVPGAPGAVSYQIGGITNPDTANKTYYARIYTYSSADGTGIYIDDGGLAFNIANRLDVNTEVPPYLLFCLAKSISGFDCASANGNFLDFGEFSKTSAKTVQSQMVIATNAGYGAGITMTGITLTSGNNIIPNLVAPTVSQPGVSQFGMNLRANSNPGSGQDPAGTGTFIATPNYNIPNRYTFNNGDVVASTTGSSDRNKFTSTYIANVSMAQNPGVYNTTLTYIALANF